jgi:hypothetical protein
MYSTQPVQRRVLALVVLSACGGGASGIRGDASAGHGGSSGGASGSSSGTSGSSSGGSGGAAGNLAGSDGAAGESGDAAAGSSGSDASDAGGDASTTFPSSLPGLVAWFDAGRGAIPTNGTISTWADLSPTGTALHAAQPAAVVMGFANGLPGINTNGSTVLSSFQPSASLGLGTGDFVIAMVVQPQPNSDILSLPVVLRIYGKVSRLAVSFVFDGSELDSTSMPCDGHVHLLVIRRSAGTAAIRVDGLADASAANAADLQASGGLQLGSGPATFAEVVVVKGPTTDDDVARLEAYLTAKYALK